METTRIESQSNRWQLRRKLRILSGILSFVGFIFNRYLVLLCSIVGNTFTLEASPYISKYTNERKSFFECYMHVGK